MLMCVAAFSIFHASWPGYIEVLKLLIERGADLNLQNGRKNTALHLLCERSSPLFVVLLLLSCASSYSCDNHRGHHESIRLFILSGANTHLLNLESKTSFMVSEGGSRFISSVPHSNLSGLQCIPPEILSDVTATVNKALGEFEAK